MKNKILYAFSFLLVFPTLLFAVGQGCDYEGEKATALLKNMASVEELRSRIYNGNTWGRNTDGWDKTQQKWFNELGFYLHAKILGMRDKREAASKQMFEQILSGKSRSPYMPSHLHVVWINKSQEAPDENIQRYLDSLSFLNSESTYTSPFWCWDKSKLPNTIEQIRKKKAVNIREVHELWKEDSRGRAIVDRLFEKNLFALCSHVLRYKIIFEYGGIYANLGTPILRSLDLLLHFEYFGEQDGFLYKANFFGAKPKFRGLNRLLEFVHTLDYRVPPPTRAFVKDSSVPWWTGDPAFTLSIERGTPLNANILVVPSNVFHQSHPMDSGSKGLFGQDKIDLESAFHYPPLIDEAYLNVWAQVKEWKSELMLQVAHKNFMGTKEYYLGQRKQSAQLREKRLFREFDNPLMRIPHISHQGWITKEKQIPLTHIQTSIERMKSLGEGWKHILWVMDEEFLADSITQIKREIPDLDVRQVYDYFLRPFEKQEDYPQKQKMYGVALFEAFYENNCFVNCLDIGRKNFLNYKVLYGKGSTVGGVYFDMGLQPKVNLTPFVDRVDYLMYQNALGLVDVTMLGCGPDDSILIKYLQILEKPYEFMCGPRDQLSIIGQFAFNVCLLSDCADKVVLPLGVFSIGNTHFNSWKTGCKALGNTPFTEFLKNHNIYDIAREYQEKIATK